jgi:hypothetical protein
LVVRSNSVSKPSPVYSETKFAVSAIGIRPPSSRGSETYTSIV